MSWSKDYKKSIDCKNPKGFSQKAHCAARKKRQRGEETKSMSPFNEDVQSVKKIKFSKFTHKTPHLKGSQHVLDPNVDLKQLVHHATVQYLDRDADGDIDIYDAVSRKTPDENVMSAPGEAQKRSLKLIAKQKGEMLHTKRGSAFEGVEMKYCKLCRKMEARTECSYGPTMWDKYSVASVHPANEQMSFNVGPQGLKQSRRQEKIRLIRQGTTIPNEKSAALTKESKVSDHEYSMARSELSTIVNGAKRLQKKMKKGEGEIEAWVQSKITKAADYIDSAADYVDSGEMNKEEVEILEGKRDGKSAKDPGYSLKDWFKGGGWVQAGGEYDGKPCAKQPGQKTKPFCRDADDRASMSKEERNRRAAKKRKEDPNPNRKGKAKFVTVEQVDASKYGKTPDQLLQDIIDKDKKGPNKYGGGQVIKTGLQKAHFEPEGQQLDELWGKVAIGAGAAFIPYLLKKFAKPAVDKAIDSPATGSDGLIDKMKQRRDAINNATQKNSYEPELDMVEEKDDCYHKVKSRYSVWPSAYASGALVKCRKVGAKNWGNKTKKEGYEFSNWRDEFFPTEVESVNIIEPQPLQASKGIGSEILDEAGKKCWKGYKKAGTQELFGKTYNRCVKEGYSDWRTEIFEDWQKVNRQDKTDGLSQAAVDAYRRENPGSKLQTAVTEKKPKGKRAKRRANFCRRMKGMKSKLTSAKTARDPDSRINKALRRWNCN